MAAYRVIKERMISRMALFVCGALLASPVLSAPPDESAVVLSKTPSELKLYAIAPGQRVYKPGKERISVTGVITYFEDSSEKTENIRIAWQFPMKVRLDQGGRALLFNRSNPGQASPRDPRVADTVQMLLEDSVEGFFALQDSRISRHFLGSGFRLEGAVDSDPGMDVFLLEFPGAFLDKKPVLKSYWFDSGTKLLGVVTYTTSSGAAVHTVLDDWRDVSGERIPFRIERWENHKPTIRLVLESAAVTAGNNDGMFGGNQ